MGPRPVVCVTLSSLRSVAVTGAPSLRRAVEPDKRERPALDDMKKR